MDKLGNILPRVVARQPAAPLLTQMRVMRALRTVLGEELAGECHAVALARGTLRLATGNPALAAQLRHDQEQLLHRVNEVLRLTRPVRRLQVRVGPPA